MLIETLCNGCDLPLSVNDLGLCNTCFGKLERDLIRARDWDYSAAAFGVDPNKRKALRQRVIQEYGEAYGLILLPDVPAKVQRKNKRTHSTENQHKREVAAHAQRDYTTTDVRQAAQDFLHDQTEEWVNFSRLAQYLYERFYKLNPKHMGAPGKKYKSLLKFAIDYPSRFTIHQDENNRSLYWISLEDKAKW